MKRPARTPGAPVCIAPACDRVVKGAGGICGRCWAFVPADLKLALHDHADAFERRNRDGRTLEEAEEYGGFIAWAWGALTKFAAWEASRYRFAKRGQFDADLEGAHFYRLDHRGAVIRVKRGEEPPRPPGLDDPPAPDFI